MNLAPSTIVSKIQPVGEVRPGSRLSRVFPPVSLAILALLHFRKFLHWDFDDAFIVYRIARNLADYGEWAFNPGERLNASTSVLNTALIWGGSYVFDSIPLAAHVVGAISIFLTSLLCFELLKRDFGPHLSLLMAAFVSWTLAHNSTWGLEGYLFAFLMFLFVYLESAKIDSWIVLGLLTLTRPDGIVLAAIRWLTALVLSRKASVRGLCRFGAVLLPWALFSLATFGQVFPDTLSNKMWQGRSGFWGHGWIYVDALGAHLVQLPKPLLVLFLAHPLGVVYLLKAKNPLSYLWVFVCVQQAVYCVLNVPGYHWYFSLLDVVGAVVGFYGFLFVKDLSWRNPFPFRLSPAWHLLLSASLSIVGLGWYAFTPRSHPVLDSRTEAYREAIRTVDEQWPSSGRLAAVEVGTFGFYTSRPIVDLVGLASDNPEFISGANNDRFFDALPDGFITHSPPWAHERAILDDVRSQLVYTKVAEFPHPVVPLAHYVKTDTQLSPGGIDEYVRKNFKSFTPLAKPPAAGPGELVCVVDQVNGNLVTPSMTISLNYRFLRAHGWSMDMKSDRNEELNFLLLSVSGQAFGAPAVRTERNDVAAYVPHRSDRRFGFETEGSLFEVPAGTYTPGLAVKRDGQGLSCVFNARILVVE